MTNIDTLGHCLIEFSSRLTHGTSKLECHITLGWKDLLGTKKSSLLGPFVSYEENEALLKWPQAPRAVSYLGAKDSVQF